MGKVATVEFAAVAALLASALLWGVSWYPFRLLAAAGVSGLWAVIATELIATALCLFLFRRQLFQHGIGMQAALALLVIGLTGGITNTGFIMATLEGNVLRATLLLYLAPLWTLFLARWLLAEPIEATGVGVVLLALTGAAVMLGPAALNGGLGAGDVLGVIAGIAYAGYNVAVRRADQIPQAHKILVAALGSAVTAALALPFVAGNWPTTLTATTWGLIVGTAVLLVLVVSLMQYGLMRVTATRAIVILVSELVFAAGSAWWLADEVPGTREFFGGALIVGASLISAGVGRGKIAQNHNS